ncbi:MAG: glycine/betaine/sarcosine/D-proline family reductase selenoprotein B [Oscillospiraceae bacterium]
MDKKRVVCYMNQFFGQIGGEDQAGVGFSVSETPIGPGVAVNAQLGDWGEVVACIVCGDNYMADDPEKAVPEGLALIEKYKPDLFIAGPAFNAGRYGLNCGRMCEAVGEKLNIPTVTGMYEENPGAELYRTKTYVIKTAISAGDMRNAVPKMVALGKRLVAGERVGPAKIDGYMKRDQLRNHFEEEVAGERGIKMLLARLKGEEYESEAEFPDFDTNYPAPDPIVDLSKATVAVVTDAGVVPKGNPDGIRDHNSTTWGEYTISTMFDGPIEPRHSGYDATYALEDLNRIYPIDVLKELEEKGVIGKVYDGIFVSSGNCAAIEDARRIGKEIAARFKEQGIDAAILTST